MGPGSMITAEMVSGEEISLPFLCILMRELYTCHFSPISPRREGLHVSESV